MEKTNIKKTIKESEFSSYLHKEDVSGLFDAFAEAFREGKVDIETKNGCHTLLPSEIVEFSASAIHAETDEGIEEESLTVVVRWKK